MKGFPVRMAAGRSWFVILRKKRYFCTHKKITQMATTADIKIGMCIEFNGKTMQIVDFQHVKPGKGPAFVRTKLKNLENGRTIDNTFTAGVAIEPVRVERRPYQYLYEDDMGCNFMHTETFEQIHREGEATMIIISHQERIIRLADEIVVIAGGKIAHRGSTEEIFPLILADTLGSCPVLDRKEGAQ